MQDRRRAGGGRAGRACGSGRETSQYRMVPSNAPDTTSSSAQGCHAAAVTSRPWPTSVASSRCVRTSYTWPRAAQRSPGQRGWPRAGVLPLAVPGVQALCGAMRAFCTQGPSGCPPPAPPSTGVPLCWDAARDAPATQSYPIPGKMSRWHSNLYPILPSLPGKPPGGAQSPRRPPAGKRAAGGAARLAGLVARRGQQPVAVRVPVRLRRGMHESAGRVGSASPALWFSYGCFSAYTAASAVTCHALRVWTERRRARSWTGRARACMTVALCPCSVATAGAPARTSHSLTSVSLPALATTACRRAPFSPQPRTLSQTTLHESFGALVDGTGPSWGATGVCAGAVPMTRPGRARQRRAHAATAAVPSGRAACGRPRARARAWLGCQAAALTSPPCAARVASASHRAKSHTCAGRPGPLRRAPQFLPGWGPSALCWRPRTN